MSFGFVLKTLIDPSIAYTTNVKESWKGDHVVVVSLVSLNTIP